MGIYERRANVARALANPARLQILEALLHQPACVYQLVALTGRRQSYISQQLAILRRAGLVERERLGLQARYRLAWLELEKPLKAVCSISDKQAQAQIADTNEGGKNMSDTKNNAWHGIPRTEIDWHPTVVPERCIGCGLCVTSCGRGVYAFDYEQNKPVVVTPQMCMVGCTTCATICPEGAIEFPSGGYIRQIIKRNKVLRQSKDMLRANREKFDVKLREKA